MMYWNKHPDGSMTRKLVEDWTPEERELHARHEAFLKEASALGYRFRTDIDTQEWIGRFAREWVGLTDGEILKIWKSDAEPKGVVEFVREIEAKLKEKNT